eukprot:s2080_g2.t1
MVQWAVLPQGASRKIDRCPIWQQGATCPFDSMQVFAPVFDPTFRSGASVPSATATDHGPWTGDRGSAVWHSVAAAEDFGSVAPRGISVAMGQGIIISLLSYAV